MYYLYNVHGDVTGLADTAGNITKTYNYDAFGVELNLDSEDTNPFRHCGEYYDKETDSIYLRARYYNPALGRFTTEDPAKDGLNWYAYCNNKPILFIDPSGLKLKLLGSENEQIQLLAIIQELTDYNLNISNIGEISIEGEPEHENFKNGNRLLKRIINSDNICIVSLSDDINQTKILQMENIENGDESDALILFNPVYSPEVPVIRSDNGNIDKEKRPSYIGMAHELIHADRAMRGKTILREYAEYKYQISRKVILDLGIIKFYTYNMNTDIAKKEELYTIGIKYSGLGDITENDIRKEHGLNLRGAYI